MWSIQRKGPLKYYLLFLTLKKMSLLSLTVLHLLDYGLWLCLTNGWLLFHLAGNSFTCLPIPFYRVIQRKSKSYSRAEKWELLSLSKALIKVSYPQKRCSGNQEWFHPSFAVAERRQAIWFSETAGGQSGSAVSDTALSRPVFLCWPSPKKQIPIRKI